MERKFKFVAIFFCIFTCNQRQTRSDVENPHDLNNEINSSTTIVGRYARYDEIVSWMTQLSCLYPEIARTYDIGRTSEGRSMMVLQLGFRRTPGAWGVWIDAGIHGREHIAPATVVYIANELVEGYRSEEVEVLRMLADINWFLVPVFNPDGYEFSHTKNRLWRKNRRRTSKLCVGVDLNRNWDIHWGHGDADNEPCSELYAGDAPATEPEILNIANFILPRASEFIAFLTYHSFGQRIFTRWDYTGLEAPADNEELINLATKISDAIGDVQGYYYKVGRAPKLISAFGGGSADWAKAVAGIKYSYLIELRDTGVHGFRLPEDEVIPTGRENWSGVKALALHILGHHPTRNSSRITTPTDNWSTSSCEKGSPKMEYISSIGAIWTTDNHFLSLVLAMALYIRNNYI